MEQVKQKNRTIEIIYTLFLGIMISVFVGLGIAAFYPEPPYPEMPSDLKVYSMPMEKSEENSREAERILNSQKEYDKTIADYQKILNDYNRNVSIIALIASVLALSISLVLSHKLLVLADGVLLGGVITLLYSVARVFGSGDDKVRFLVVAVGLCVALILGYIKFIRPASVKST